MPILKAQHGKGWTQARGYVWVPCGRPAASPSTSCVSRGLPHALRRKRIARATERRTSGGLLAPTLTL